MVSSMLKGLEAGHADVGVTGTDEAKPICCALREIDNATFDEWPAIIDAHNDRLAVALVGDFDACEPNGKVRWAAVRAEGFIRSPDAVFGMQGIPGSTATG